MNKIVFPFDINCDLGEGMGNDAALMPYIDSCNIACGGHTGDEKSIEDVLRLAKQFNVKVGAHPSFPDRENFGRNYMQFDLHLLHSIILKQIRFFERICEKEDIEMQHVKLHGALYNFAAKDEFAAFTVIHLIEENFPNVYLYCPSDSLLSQMAMDSGIKIKREIFADRNYYDDLTLVERSHPNALLTDSNDVLDHVGWMVKEKKIKSITGKMVPIEAETICVHGDNPEALAILKTIRGTFRL